MLILRQFIGISLGVLLIRSCFHTRSALADDESQYVLVGVSGGLQDGFPERSKMDYNNEDDEGSGKAIFLGKGLIRGYKAFLDVMEVGYRQYVVSFLC
jgi:hypothetical protein